MATTSLILMLSLLTIILNSNAATIFNTRPTLAAEGLENSVELLKADDVDLVEEDQVSQEISDPADPVAPMTMFRTGVNANALLARIMATQRRPGSNSRREKARHAMAIYNTIKKIQLGRVIEQRRRMRRCIEALNEDICKGRGSFYQWGRDLARGILDGTITE